MGDFSSLILSFLTCKMETGPSPAELVWVKWERTQSAWDLAGFDDMLTPLPSLSGPHACAR